MPQPSMHFGYADPPYIGCAKKHYGRLGGSEVDHATLIAELERNYPNGWALSASATSVPDLYPLMPADIRLMPWVKRLVFFKPGVNPCYGWEAVFVHGGRKRTRQQPTIYDWLEANATFKRGLAGAKPDKFFYWLFSILNIQAGDTLDDLYPGTGRCTTALAQWLSQQPLPRIATVKPQQLRLA